MLDCFLTTEVLEDAAFKARSEAGWSFVTCRKGFITRLRLWFALQTPECIWAAWPECGWRSLQSRTPPGIAAAAGRRQTGVAGSNPEHVLRGPASADRL